MIEQANEFKDNVPDPVSPSVDSERDFSYVQSEVHFNTVEFDLIPATDLNTSNESIDSYMRDIGDSHFISLIKPSIPFNPPCCSYDIVPEPSIPLISDVAPTHSRYTLHSI